MDIINSTTTMQVLDSEISYINSGSGRPIIFIHGMPTSSFLWRHIIEDLQQDYNCLALDLIGMGNSGKPDIEYNIHDHINYFSAWLEQLNLDTKPILVMHGWGSVIGTEYARLHQDSVAGLVFYEAHLRAAKKWSMLSLPVQQWSAELLQHRKYSKRAVLEQNVLVNDLFPCGSLHKFSASEMASYRAPFQTSASRAVLWQYLQELPLGEQSPGISDLIDNYSSWLQKCTIPKLLCFGVPGFTTTIDTIDWAKHNISELSLCDIGDALHFAQESSPKVLASNIAIWLKDVPILSCC